LKYAIPRNGDAEVYQLLSIARYFKSPYLCTRNRESAVMLATLEWIEPLLFQEARFLKLRPQTDNRTLSFSQLSPTKERRNPLHETNYIRISVLRLKIKKITKIIK